jgi:hypothetical protein
MSAMADDNSVPLPPSFYSDHFDEFRLRVDALRGQEPGSAAAWNGSLDLMLDLGWQVSRARHTQDSLMTADQIRDWRLFGYTRKDGSVEGGWLPGIDKKLDTIAIARGAFWTNWWARAGVAVAAVIAGVNVLTATHVLH